MSSPIARSLSSLSLSSQSQTMASLTRFASSDSKGKEKAKTADEDMAEARRWLSDLDPETIPKSISQMTFDKASGDGMTSAGRARARLQTPLEKLLPLIPKPLHESIRNHRHYVKKADSLVFTSEEDKKQKDNRDACFRKQYATLQELGKDNIPSSEGNVNAHRAWVPAGDMRKWSSHHIREYQQKVRKEKTSLQAQQLIEKGRLRRKERVESPATKESEDRHSHPHR